MALWTRPNGPQSTAFTTSQAGLNQQAALGAAVQPATLVLTAATEAVVPHPQNPSIAYVCSLSPSEGNEAVPFDLVVSGYVTTTNTTNVTLKLYSGTSLTVASDVALAASAATAQNTASAPFEIHAHLLYDSVSGKLTGWFDGLVNNTLITKAALSNIVTGIKDTNNPVANFVLSATSSAAASGFATTVVVKNFTVG